MTRKTHLPSDATIADVLPGLEEAEAYLRTVLSTMRLCQKHYGDAWVRIGVTAKNGAPSYRVDRPDASPGASDEGRAVFGAYGGKSHDRFTQVNTAETRWSSRALGMAEMLALNDSLRRSKDGERKGGESEDGGPG
ncbi:hypothetical protein [Methylobacterium trifolii]|uniref:Uncharacterized protein n=1 Tax=Methylobacterium trifolii TaxID=1003092 RepID=A0ABQ4TVG4_9HYPH|nr:hypothetical protein [Methylobacterium trifolii]GJE59278.1 hypothetical protein MPOCJGCO_1366 [Methylobacterium trifolii]